LIADKTWRCAARPVTPVTRHLQVLADAGLVKDLKIGRERLWQFDPAQLDEARRSLELIGRQWEQALGKLKASLES